MEGKIINRYLKQTNHQQLTLANIKQTPNKSQLRMQISYKLKPSILTLLVMIWTNLQFPLQSFKESVHLRPLQIRSQEPRLKPTSKQQTSPQVNSLSKRVLTSNKDQWLITQRAINHRQILLLEAWTKCPSFKSIWRGKKS